MLLARLPEEAWCQQEAGAPVERWDVSRELLAQIADHLTVLASNSRYKEPIRIPRPGTLGHSKQQAADRPKASSKEEVAAFFRARRVRS